MTAKIDTRHRYLSIYGDTKTDRAHSMWYDQMTWADRQEILSRPEIAEVRGIFQKLRAAINWVEDNLVE